MIPRQINLRRRASTKESLFEIGLRPLGTYRIAVYSYDCTGSHTTNWSATEPEQQLQAFGYFANYTNTFAAPADEQSISWTAGTTPAPAIFTVTADGYGDLPIYGWSGDGISGDQSADTTYINGFQIASVSEPGTLVLIGLAARHWSWQRVAE